MFCFFQTRRSQSYRTACRNLFVKILQRKSIMLKIIEFLKITLNFCYFYTNIFKFYIYLLPDNNNIAAFIYFILFYFCKTEAAFSSRQITSEVVFQFSGFQKPETQSEHCEKSRFFTMYIFFFTYSDEPCYLFVFREALKCEI